MMMGCLALSHHDCAEAVANFTQQDTARIIHTIAFIWLSVAFALSHLHVLLGVQCDTKTIRKDDLKVA